MTNIRSFEWSFSKIRKGIRRFVSTSTIRIFFFSVVSIFMSLRALPAPFARWTTQLRHPKIERRSPHPILQFLFFRQKFLWLLTVSKIESAELRKFPADLGSLKRTGPTWTLRVECTVHTTVMKLLTTSYDKIKNYYREGDELDMIVSYDENNDPR